MKRIRNALYGGLAALTLAYAPAKAAEIGTKEQTIASAYQRLDRLDLENVIAHDEENNTNYDLTLAQTPVSAAPDTDALAKLLNSRKVTVTHNHPVSIDAYVDLLLANGRRDLAHAVKKQDPSVVKRRLLYERPSDADIAFMVSSMLQGYATRPDSQVTQQILVTEDNKPFKVIEYDLAKPVKEKVKELGIKLRSAYEKAKKTKDVNEFLAVKNESQQLLEGIVSSYRNNLQSYDQARARPWDSSKPEPSAREFFNLVNSRGVIELKDRGYVGEARPLRQDHKALPYQRAA